jgi:hypothetical protein
LVTGLPRSGTSWVGKMLEASGAVVYVNEPMNPSHPPGRSPGVLDAPVEHYFHYICAENEAPWLAAFEHTVRLHYRLGRELRRNHGPYDLARAAKYWAAFTRGRLRGRRALLDDPYALFATPWLVDRLHARAVVLVRDPTSLAGSWKRLGWQVDTAELLGQPLLMRDYLEDRRAELTAAAGRGDWLAGVSALWNAATTATLAFAEFRPAIKVQRYEDLAADPIDGFRSLYGHLGVPWSGEAEAKIATATTAGDGSAGGFRWSLRGGLSRTAYRPMDSETALGSYRDRLTEAEIERSRTLTSEVADRLRAYGA